MKQFVVIIAAVAVAMFSLGYVGGNARGFKAGVRSVPPVPRCPDCECPAPLPCPSVDFDKIKGNKTVTVHLHQYVTACDSVQSKIVKR